MHSIFSRFRPRAAFALAALTLSLAGCASSGGGKPAVAWSQARQLVLVTTSDWNTTTGELRRFERDGAQWRQIGETAPVSVGRAGTAWGIGLHPSQNDG